MARKKKNTNSVEEALEAEVVEKEEPKAVMKKAPVKKEAMKESKPPQMITFDRWFIGLGKPMRHKAGMAAYIGKQAKSKKTVEAWNSLFEAY